MPTYQLRKAIGGGQCCECADQIDPCNCGAYPCVLECETKGPATYTLCGYPEWSGHLSVPPKKYRKLTMGGSYTFTGYTDATCTVLNGSNVTCNWSGTCTIDATTCALTTGAVQNCGGADAPQCITPGLGGDFAIGGPDSTTTSTDWDAKVTGTCRFSGSPAWGKYTVASQFAHLSVEDTDEDAIARANIPLSWSSVVDCSTAYAYKVTRGAGAYSGTFKSVRVRCQVSGLTPGQSYTVIINIYDRALGSSDTWLLFTQIGISFVATATTATTDWQDVPSTNNTETKAGFCTVSKAS